MNLLDFGRYFPNEETCIEHFKTEREKNGLRCKRCNNTTHYWKKDKMAFQCKKCGYRTALRSGTVLENSHLPYLYWYKAILMLSATKKTFSANEVQCQLRHDVYEPIWKMLHKIREAMGKRDTNYKPTEFIEIDESFFETTNTKKRKDRKIKRVRENQKIAKVLVLIEPISEKNKHNTYKPAGHIKMIVMDGSRANKINRGVEAIADNDTIILSNDNNKQNDIEKVVKRNYIIKLSDIKEVKKTLPWVHSAIGNAKKILKGIHHCNGKDYLQNYLNEFCYKYNRRYFGEKLFERLLVACINYS
ncbi:MAG: IS1595 family transposase [Bacteroidetes bacterium]|nr:IS1595 family transposase [Bacteroidota bacterium]